MEFPRPTTLLFGFLICAFIFIPLESLLPHREQRRLRPGFATDTLHFFLNPFLRKLALAIVLLPAVLVLDALAPAGLRAAIRAQPVWLQFVEALVLADLGGYWGHRLEHTVPWLWRFHAVHHSSEQLDWLAAARLHPLSEALARACAILPLYFLGFSKATFGAFLVLMSLYAIFLHANVRVRFPWLEKFIALPAFHHWHHARGEQEALNKNYAGLFPWIDRLFGTHHLPARWPEQYGIDEPMPRGYAAQLWHPFRATETATTETASLNRPAAAAPRQP
ncbi:MAG: sterol desaturase family protein [Verrucomicrobia bacterium]|nr:sterol desaturase family protein [Verrucomicrobiota bacterium]